ncbi:ribosome small subunit-dependent GTPase A [Candidatus Poribacteria bacterium]|nr:ribosome small subunit-dependent GTPase A [Candidatus Poribacteria bacterium]
MHEDLVLRCTLRGSQKRQRYSNTGRRLFADPIAVGDQVIFTQIDQEEGVIEEILPRETKFSRQYAGKHESIEQIIVANASQVVVVVSTHMPPLNYRTLDRFLILAEAGEMSATICVNKMDLVNTEEKEELISTFNTYENLGYPVVYTSINSAESIENFRNVIKDKFSVIVGASGVGKSSLLNSIQPNLELRTGEVGEKTRKGKHTTTLVELFSLNIGGEVADTPGIREVGLWGVDTDNLEYYFPEMEPLIGSCKYKDCAHIKETDCAMQEAVEKGNIHPERYNSYIVLKTGNIGEY